MVCFVSLRGHPRTACTASKFAHLLYNTCHVISFRPGPNTMNGFRHCVCVCMRRYSQSESLRKNSRTHFPRAASAAKFTRMFYKTGGILNESHSQELDFFVSIFKKLFHLFVGLKSPRDIERE